jgi:hypothetical protein
MVNDFITCHKREPSIEVSRIDCRFSYKMAIDNPSDQAVAACASCDRGREIFYSPDNGKGGRKKMGTTSEKKLCANSCGRAATKGNLCGYCNRKINGKKADIPQKAASPGKYTPLAQRRQAKAGVKAKSRTTGQAPASGGPVIPIAVDFTEYPKLHARLMDLARQQHRTPDMQLMHMLDETFAAGERAEK